MTQGIVWCPYCGEPHDLEDRFCRKTGKVLDRKIHGPHAAGSKRHPLHGAVIDGRYKIGRRIGSGGMGAVFEAVHIGLDRRVAVKVVSRSNRDSRSRLRKEGAIIASLHHPNLCDVYDIGRMPDGAPYLVLELLGGETLAARMKRVHRLPVGEVLDIFTQILSGLRCAHAAGIIHRDLKPANIFLVERLGCASLVKILDFGLAKNVHRRLDETALTRPGRSVGTPAYMSPEQILGGTVDARSDLFAIGILLFHALTKEHPFAVGADSDYNRAIFEGSPRSLADRRPVPVELAALVDRCLAKDVLARPQSAAEVQDVVAGLLAEEETTHVREIFDEGPTVPRLGGSSSAVDSSDAAPRRAHNPDV